MINVFDYIDYRVFLREFYESKKKEIPYFSLRYIGNRVGMDPGNIVKLFQGKRNLSKKLIAGFITLCKFNTKEAKYFEALVKFGKAKKENEVKRLFEELISIKDILPVKVRADRYEFYRKWYYTAVAALLNFYEFRGDYKALASQLTPPISVKQAKESIRLLEKLTFIKRDKDGRYVLTNNLITTGEEWRSLAVRKFQEETIKLAFDSLTNHPKKERDISTLSITVSPEDLKEIKELTREYRKSVLKIVDESESPQRAYQLNIQLFPLTKVKRTGHGKI